MMYTFIILAFTVSIFLIWKVPYWNLKQYKNELTNEQFLNLINENRKTVAQILGGVYIFLGLGFTWNQITSTKESLVLSEKRYVRESFTDAIRQIGSNEPQIRLGGIYSLGNLMVESTRYSEIVIQILSTYIRQNYNDTTNYYLKEELQAAINVTTKNEFFSSKMDGIVNLNGIVMLEYNFDKSQLINSKLFNSKFIGSQFVRANLEGAHAYSTLFINCNLFDANLSKADFTGSEFKECQMVEANLTHLNARRSDFIDVNMENTNFTGADLSEGRFYNTNLQGCILKNTNLCGTNLKTAKGLTTDQIKYAITDSRTILPNIKQ